MGSPLSPVLANLYMAYLEMHIVSLPRYQDISYYRYLDDILMVHINHGMAMSSSDKESMIRQMDLITTKLHGRSKFLINLDLTTTARKVGEYVEFLDLKIWIGYNSEMVRSRCIRVSLFDKPTNLHIYTDPSTFYPFHYIYNWIQGENIRLIRNSSTRESYEASLNDFIQFLSRRKYHSDLINQFVRKNYYDDRVALLQGGKPHKNREGNREYNDNTKQIMVRNSGLRPFITHNISLMNNFVNACSIPIKRLQPIVMKGKSVISVFDSARKNLEA